MKHAKKNRSDTFTLKKKKQVTEIAFKDTHVRLSKDFKAVIINMFKEGNHA